MSAPPTEPNLSEVRLILVHRSQLAIEQLAQAVSVARFAAEIVVCRTAAAALAALRARPAHLGIFGLSLPDMDGLDLLARVVAERRVLRILVVSSRSDERARQLLRPGKIDGFLDTATTGFAKLVDAIRTVAGGGIWFQRESVAPASRAAGPRLDQMFTPRELRVFALLGGGLDDRGAAKILGVSEHTVHGHRNAIMRKLGVHTRVELMREALRRGVVRITPDGILHPGFDDEAMAEVFPKVI